MRCSTWWACLLGSAVTAAAAPSCSDDFAATYPDPTVGGSGGEAGVGGDEGGQAGVAGAGGHTATGGQGGDGGNACDALDCPGADSDCRYRGCVDGACTIIDADTGTTCDDDGGQLCDGEGACVECLTIDDCASPEICQSHACVPPGCIDGTLGGDETDVDCGGAECLPCENGDDCLLATDCASSFCDGSTCAACADDVDCAGAPDTYCRAGRCEPTKVLADICVSDNECASGFCPEADGVCCDAVCEAVCEACLSAKTGLAIGHCGAVETGTDPDAECEATSPESCGAIGEGCNGDAEAPGCISYDSATSCTASSCVEGVHSPERLCDGAGSCVVVDPVSCEPYVCDADGTACVDTCTDGDDCHADYYCDANGACVAKKADGASCAFGTECESGFCPADDAVCCNAACNETCEACLYAKTGTANGTCDDVTNGTDPDDECLATNCQNGLCL